MVELPTYDLSVAEEYGVIPADFLTAEELPTYEIRSDTEFDLVPPTAPTVDLPVYDVSVAEEYTVVPTDFPTAEVLPTYELSPDTEFDLVPATTPTVDLPVYDLSSTEEYAVVPDTFLTAEELPTYELNPDTGFELVPEDYPTVDELPSFDLSSLAMDPALNTNWTTYEAENGSERRILWAKGVQAPRMGDGGDFKKSVYGDYVDYKAPFVLNQGWYDTNKRRDGDSRIDASLCFAAVSTNMLYWWLEQNQSEVKQYLEQLEASGQFEGIEADTIKDIRYLVHQPGLQQNSAIYNLFVQYFYDKFNGYQSDILMDFFINGYVPKPGGGTNDEEDDFVKDKRAGFFNAVFGNKKLTDRRFSGSYQSFSQTVKTALENNQLIGMEHLLSPVLNHIVTLWGAEFDENNRLVAVYVTDSDDQDEAQHLGMKRYLVKDVNGRVKVSTNINQAQHGSYVEYLHLLSLGKEQWQAYLANQD